MSGSRVITIANLEIIDDLPQPPSQIPTLRLRVHQQPSSNRTWMPESERWVQSFIHKIEQGREINLDQKNSAEATQKNREKLRVYHEKLRKDLESQYQRASDSLDGMTPEEQEHVLAYWEGVSSFLTNILEWIKDMFLLVIKKIKEGFRLLKETLVDVFNTVTNAIKQILGD